MNRYRDIFVLLFFFNNDNIMTRTAQRQNTFLKKMLEHGICVCVICLFWFAEDGLSKSWIGLVTLKFWQRETVELLFKMNFSVWIFTFICPRIQGFLSICETPSQSFAEIVFMDIYLHGPAHYNRETNKTAIKTVLLSFNNLKTKVYPLIYSQMLFSMAPS